MNQINAKKPPIRIAALVDLPRTERSGGHVKYWERLAEAAALETDAAFDLTVYFSGDRPDESLGPHVRLRCLPPVFSTARLKFLPYIPDHTDLAPYHWRLARLLPHYDLIHTTDAFFAFARTAERVARARAIPLTNSFHTDTPAYARLFTRQTIDKLFASRPWIRRKLNEDWDAPERQGRKMQRRLEAHLRQSAGVFVTREDDRRLAENFLKAESVNFLRLGVDKTRFGPHRRDVAGVRRDYAIPADRAMALFVGRVDAGKNAGVLMEATARAIASGAPLHLIVAGVGPMMGDLAARLGERVSLPGFVAPQEMVRLYASVDFLAFPSEVEVASMATTEAVASGCPVLVAAASGSAALFDAMAGLRAVEGGVAPWAKALHDLSLDLSKRSQMRQAALDFSASRLATWSGVLNEDLLPGWRKAMGR